jgi:F0F1-type ATP synthase assembly protein I
MPDDKNDNTDWSGLAEGWALAILFPAAIGMGFLLGLGVDKFFSTGPWGKLIGTGLGVLAAFVQLFRVGLRDDSR